MLKKGEFVSIPLLKRIFDVVVSLLLIIILLPVFLFIFLMLLTEQLFVPSARGSLFYCEERISGGQLFKLCKIRIAKVKAIEKLKQDEGFIHTAHLEKDKNNLTSVGWLIKQFYLDEIPQLFSVLKGEMSLVGPRPVNLKNYQQLMKEGIYTKSASRAGLTGYFQSYKGKFSKGDIEMDTEYIEFCRTHSARQILWFDLKVIGRTVLRVLEHKGI